MASLTVEEIVEKVKAIVVDKLSVEMDEVVAEASFVEDLGADSLALLNLAEVIALQCDVDIQGDDLVDIDSVGELVNLVESRMR